MRLNGLSDTEHKTNNVSFTYILIYLLIYLLFHFT